MAPKAGSVGPKAQAGASPLVVHEPLIIAAAFLDGVVAVSGVPVMVAQAPYVSFPSGAHLAAYQLCFLFPQLITTLVAEQLTLHVSASALLLFTLICSTGSAAIVALSLSQRAVSLFFASHILNGVFRHTKTLFGVTAKALHMPTTDVSAAARYGMMAGMLLSGIAGDIMRDAVQVAQLFIGVEAVAATLVLAHLLLRSRTVVVTARASQEYAQWLPSLTRAPAAVHRSMWALIAVMLASSVNQVMYPIAAPAYGLPYSFAGAHLCFNMVLQMVLMPSVVEAAKRMARRWKSNVLLTGSEEDKLSVTAGLLLLAGCTVVPYASDCGPFVFYPASLLLVDLPAGVLATLAANAVQETFGHGSGDRPKVTRLLAHITQLVKMFAAPLRICTAESLRGYKYPVRYISIPLMTYVLVYTRTHNVTYAVAGLATMLFLLTSTVSSFDGEL
ncbi:conserved hypothetical protein [Leishmania mexicana MHOM/GT/2001/U1103]|uniref:Uncharacterized protein n=1 Tax=Leishmania mexicana (strain MHOM/GT/2001/U1103) TaxID=929439 RepID=E9ANR9_LEIMU|nr:conserved hypothetical protein [Leishmania mexicana MHOM/GT/2001/U1103]CBZ24583.1 conserved hypothetical protein [Leishmania mexicana MHOM/GT/2001/U1103]